MVGFAVVGLGMGRGRAKLITQTEGARLSCVCDLRDELAREVGEELSCDWTSSLDDALARDDVDAVLVMTPSGLHAKIGVQVAHAGKHVITTKPMDVSTAACDELIEAAASTGGNRLPESICGYEFPRRQRLAAGAFRTSAAWRSPIQMVQI